MVRPREHDKVYSSLRTVLRSKQPVKHRILAALAQASERWVAIEYIVNRVPNREMRFVIDNIQEFIEGGILIKEADVLVGFRDPIARLLTQLHFEEHSNPGNGAGTN